MIVRVVLACLFGMVNCMNMVAMRDMSVMTSLVMVARFMMIGCGAMMFGRVLMMLGSLTMMVGSFFRHIW